MAAKVIKTIKIIFYIAVLLGCAFVGIIFFTYHQRSSSNNNDSDATTSTENYSPVSLKDVKKSVGDDTNLLIEYDGHVYGIFNIEKLKLTSYDKCEEYCEQLGGHLAVINSREENNFLFKYVMDSEINTTFFGYTDQDKEGDWNWVDGRSSNYTNWTTTKDRKEPNNGKTNKKKEPENYVEFDLESRNGTWNDERYGKQTKHFLCEWE